MQTQQRVFSTRLGILYFYPQSRTHNLAGPFQKKSLLRKRQRIQQLLADSSGSHAQDNSSVGKDTVLGAQEIIKMDLKKHQKGALGGFGYGALSIGKFFKELFVEAWKMAPWSSQTPRIHLVGLKELVWRVVLVIIAMTILLVIVSTIDSVFMLLMYKMMRRVA
eukprot:TRINITY_DN21725_c0_g1_i1.p4 TRINITY_DN21725_c0_g1~~TRINITY_DN21725_c0_g1_i1.p4  ORF type:complete len:164 (-),score=12.32 TRINITY_DN21725_c0_g1_i1:740-1231(-)